MSRNPNPNQVAELRQCSELVRKFDLEIERLVDLIHESTKQLEATRASRGRNADRAMKLLEMMDCLYQSNHGFESRMVWLLSEFAAPKGSTVSEAPP